ncbi:MAG: site-specific integrase [Treponema sp.]|jgi:integrase|nr:site-specific integrase [Treponema sp.]
MSVRIREKRGKLYLDIHVNGRRFWETLGLSLSTDKQQRKEILRLAEICRSKRESQIVSGEWGLIDPVSGKQSLIGYMTAIGKGREKKDHVNRVLKYLDTYQGGNIALGQVTEKWLEDFQGYLIKESGLSKGTAGRYEAAVRFALRKAARDRLIPRNPSQGVKAITIPESDLVFLSFQEIQLLANTPLGGILGAEVKRAFLFACFTGLRISDLKTLTWGDINRDPLQINKRQEKTERKIFVPLHPVAWDIINDGAIHNYKELVFPELSQSKTDTVSNYLVPWAKKAGIEKQIGWHTARRTFAVLSLESGAEIYTVSKLLGHTNLKTTQVYAKATDKMKREAVDALPSIEIRQERK